MKKLHLLFGVLIIVGCLQTYAAKSGVYMDFYKYGHEDKNTTVHRFPMRIPINVYYDNELRQIEISGSVDIDVQIFLCDENGNLLPILQLLIPMERNQQVERYKLPMR